MSAASELIAAIQLEGAGRTYAVRGQHEYETGRLRVFCAKNAGEQQPLQAVVDLILDETRSGLYVSGEVCEAAAPPRQAVWQRSIAKEPVWRRRERKAGMPSGRSRPAPRKPPQDIERRRRNPDIGKRDRQR